MKAWTRQNRGLAGYLFFVTVVLAAVTAYHLHSENQGARRERFVCRALEQVTENQRFVLATLTVVIAHQTTLSPAPNLIARLEEMERRMNLLPKYDCENGLVSVA